MKNQLSSINARVYREHEKPTVPACPAGEHTRSKWEVDAPNGAHGPCWVRAFGESPMHNLICECAGSSPTREANARLIARVPDLLADNAQLRAALTSFIETWDALPDECRRAANGATNFGRLITTLRAALAGKEAA